MLLPRLQNEIVDNGKEMQKLEVLIAVPRGTALGCLKALPLLWQKHDVRLDGGLAAVAAAAR